MSQVGNTVLRDVYVYREGFYRGLTIALALLGIGIVCSWARWRWAVAAPSITCFVAALVLALGAAILAFKRFTRFVRYRVQNSIFAASVHFIVKHKDDPA